MLKFLTVMMMFLFSAQLMAENNAPSNVVLYYSPTCGHCQKVLSYLQKEHKTVSMKNIKESTGYREYKSLGVSGVPVLVVDGHIIQGDVGIINYFKDHPEVLR
jgi:hypothetical protein